MTGTEPHRFLRPVSELPASGDPEAKVRALPCWRGAVRLTPLRGGLSNASFRVDDDAGAHVARVGSDFPFHHVFRDREAAASRWAHEAGIAPQVRFHGDGVLVTAFIEGETLDAAGVRSWLDRVVDLLVRAHKTLRQRARGPAAFFCPFHVARDYAETLRAGGHAIAPELPRLEAIAAELETAQAPMPIVFGHHDLLPANWIDDGERLWLIDWEYAAFGSPMFDLANLSDSAGLDEAQEHRLLSAYFGRAPEAETLRAFEAMKVASALREAMWAMVSELHLAAPGADYGAYAKTCLQRFEAAWAACQTWRSAR